MITNRKSIGDMPEEIYIASFINDKGELHVIGAFDDMADVIYFRNLYKYQKKFYVNTYNMSDVKSLSNMKVRKPK